VVVKISPNRTGIAAGGGFEKRPPATDARFCLKVEDKNKCPINNVQPELKLIANRSRS